MTGKNPVDLVPLPVDEMLKTALRTNDDPRRPVAEEFINKRRRDVLGAAFTALMLAPPSVAAAEPLVTLPAPPFELPVLPPVSGTWTVMVGVGGEYKPDFEGANRSMLSPVPIFAIRRAGSTDQFAAPATAQASR